MSHKFKYTTTLELELDRCGHQYGGGPCTAGVEIHAGTSVGAGGNFIDLAASASAVDDFYNGKRIVIDDGHLGRNNLIVDYDGALKRAYIAGTWIINTVKQSDSLTVSPWLLEGGATRTADQVRGPFGVLADEISNGGAPGDQLKQVLGFGSGSTRRNQTFFKNKDSGRTRWGMFHETVNLGGYIILAWNGEVPSIESAPDAETIELEYVARGWWRCAFTSTWLTAPTHRLFINPDWDGNNGSIYATRFQSALAVENLTPYPALASSILNPTAHDYRILEAGAECYNTFGTCQDRANFLKESKTYQFADRGASIPIGSEIRPYITAKDFAATEIDLERGLARRGTVTFDLRDDPAPDGSADPYRATRPTPAAGGWAGSR